jgi:hypothetical protein
LVIEVAVSSESAMMIEYPLAIVPTGQLLIFQSLVMFFAIGLNGFPPSTRALTSFPNQVIQSSTIAFDSTSLAGILPPL